MKHILYCDACKTYTLHDACPSCGAKARQIVPVRYSPDDKFGAYRRKAKAQAGTL